ncbi:O-fucosyltransferase family protein [Actinidia rufa]|uniref:O-fucosyltransferase family protein n=1 Tax=Actinidia rufa TaxID=165716 RepID=A0A7J0F300_9ERIC|nr:O-fucosyltransferase family protein [Actinidia rufa]
MIMLLILCSVLDIDSSIPGWSDLVKCFMVAKIAMTLVCVGLILRAIGFDNSTRIYLAAGELFGGERFMKPFRSLFSRLENHSTVDHSEELVENTQGLLGSAVDYMNPADKCPPENVLEILDSQLEREVTDSDNLIPANLTTSMADE